MKHDKVIKLINDVATRWNSTYYLLRRGVVLRDSIDRYLQMEQADPATTEFLYGLEITKSEWRNLILVVDHMKALKEASVQLEASK